MCSSGVVKQNKLYFTLRGYGQWLRPITPRSIKDVTHRTPGWPSVSALRARSLNCDTSVGVINPITTPYSTNSPRALFDRIILSMWKKELFIFINTPLTGYMTLGRVKGEDHWDKRNPLLLTTSWDALFPTTSSKAPSHRQDSHNAAIVLQQLWITGRNDSNACFSPLTDNMYDNF